MVDHARRGTIPGPTMAVAAAEGVDETIPCSRIADGSAVIMVRGERAIGIGKGLRTKVNVNLGTSTSTISVDDEIRKACVAEEFGADTISDLSMGGDIDAIRQAIQSCTILLITTVPVCQTVVKAGLRVMTADDILATMRMQGGQGISSFVIHCVDPAMLSEFRKKMYPALPDNRPLPDHGGDITALHIAEAE